MRAWRAPTGSVTLREPLQEAPGREFLLLPCGTCIGCRKSRAREWALRCQLELAEHTDATWVTLTYAPEYVPRTLVPDHLSKFMFELRRFWRRRRKVRFFASGEYGEQTERPHYHAVVYSVPQDHYCLQDLWPFGHVRSDPVTPQTIAYTAGYCSKKVGWKLDAGERIDYETGEVYDFQPPFIKMSRRPGIGSNARKRYPASWRELAIYNGLPIPVPRYLHQGWLETATPTQIQQLTEETKAKPHRDTSRTSLQAAEAHAVSLHNIASARRRTL